MLSTFLKIDSWKTEGIDDVWSRNGSMLRPHYRLTQRCLVARLDVQGTISDHSQQKKAQVVRLFLECLGGRRLLSLEAITEADVVRFRDELLAAGRRAVIVNGLVRKNFSEAFSRGSSERSDSN
jgi:hypothetical protein